MILSRDGHGLVCDDDAGKLVNNQWGRRLLHGTRGDNGKKMDAKSYPIILEAPCIVWGPTSPTVWRINKFEEVQ